MPNTKSAKKALRQNIKRRKKNLARKADLKEMVRNYKKLVAEGKKDEAKTFLSDIHKTFDKMAKVNLIKKNKSSRMKSRLSSKLSQK